jgi:hypothetical protein
MSGSDTGSARAEASRRNGARSRGPRSAAGKARSAQSALKHGLRARRVLLIADEDTAEFGAFAAALQAELAPVGALQEALAARIIAATWRARRADRLEAGLLGRYLAYGDGVGEHPSAGAAVAALGAGLIRDGHGARALETLVRYRGSVLAELFRSLAALAALQGGAAPAELAEERAPGRAILIAPAAAGGRRR